MAKRVAPKQETEESFGRRMARLRGAAGYSQRELAVELGISQRMVAYYESKANRPPAKLLPALAKLLGVSADDMLGNKPLPTKKRPPEGRLWRRFQELEQLPSPQRRQLVQLIDAFLEREKLREKLRESGSRT